MTSKLPALPAHLKDVQNWGLVAAGKKGIGASRGAHLSVANQDFVLVEANGQESKAGGFDEKLGGRFFRAVIVAVSDVQSRIFYDSTWQPGQEYYNPPTCFSEDGVTPSPEATGIQHPTCSRCPQAAWGSKQGVGGSKAQACQDGKRIVLFVPDNGFYGFRITPGSFKTWQSYLSTLEGEGVEPQFFMTRFQFVSQGVLAFIADSYVTEENVKAYNKPDVIKRLLKPAETSPPVQIAPTFDQPVQIARPSAPVQPYIPMPTVPPPGDPDNPRQAMKAPRKPRATKAEMEMRRNGFPSDISRFGREAVSEDTSASPPPPPPPPPLPPSPAPAPATSSQATPIFGQASPGIVEDPALRAALAAAFSV